MDIGWSWSYVLCKEAHEMFRIFLVYHWMKYFILSLFPELVTNPSLTEFRRLFTNNREHSYSPKSIQFSTLPPNSPQKSENTGSRKKTATWKYETSICWPFFYSPSVTLYTYYIWGIRASATSMHWNPTSKCYFKTYEKFNVSGSTNFLLKLKAENA